MLKISDEEMKIVLDIIKKKAEDCEVLVFGSRIKGTEKIFADLDLAFKCEDGLGLNRSIELELEFEESSLPYRVDVIDYNRTSKDFQKIIDKHNEKIYG